MQILPENKHFATIYSLSCPITHNVRYIGKTYNIIRRIKEHLICNEKSYRVHWIKNLKKKGLTPSIDIIDVVPYDESNFWEQHYISLFKSWGFKLVNSTEGGDGTIGFKHREDSKKLMSLNCRKHQTEETKRKISATLKGKTPSNYAVFREACKKQPFPPERIEKMSIVSKELIRSGKIGFKGKHHTQSAKDKISKTHKGKKIPKWHLQKVIQANILRLKKPLLQYDLKMNFIKKWDGPIYVERELGLPKWEIINSFKRKKRHGIAHGFFWCYEK